MWELRAVSVAVRVVGEYERRLQLFRRGSGQPPYISKHRNSNIVVEPETKTSSWCYKSAGSDLWHNSEERTNENERAGTVGGGSVPRQLAPETNVS